MATGSMTGKRRELSAADVAARKAAGKQKAADALARLDAQVANIVENDPAFREYLRVSGKLHRYSWGNRMLIMLQRDTAMVAGFHRWIELGRPVLKGSKGIQILAPMVVKEKHDPSLAGYSTNGGTVAEDGSVSKVIGYRVSYVFAVEDTDGAPIGHPRPVPETDDSDASRELCQRLTATARALGFDPIIRSGDDLGNGSDGSPAGWANLETREIVVNADLPAAAIAKTLAHEIAHLVADHKSNADNRKDAEAVAEGAAFIVAAHFDLDTEGYSAPYIAGWAEDMARVRRLLDRVGKVAGEIIDAAEAQGGCSACGWDGVADGGCLQCR